jgi:hypothetical protein
MDHQRLRFFLKSRFSVQQRQCPLPLAALQVQLTIDLPNLALQAFGCRLCRGAISEKGLATREGQEQCGQ